ncbi:hypothetical protein ARMGADRAFT_1049109 [Armillaria gallica]|uniref:Uncharacterized protein n=1 Tax=Armillaria gallica TaxID=47427 RepID=A0A2H3CEN4_ARMGA|nr:hypothetical protein ARMGADRAFT_1049109 [Armillaria gallica]
MHLIWENLIKNLILLWTGEFKGLDEGTSCYAIGKATAMSGSTIPSAYGSRVPNVSMDCSNMSAEMWSFWTLYLGPVLLQHRFKDVKYFKHFVHLAALLNLCLQFEINMAEIRLVQEGFISWVKDYEQQWDWFVLESAQLTQLQTLYKLHNELALRPPHRGKILGSFQNEFYPTCILLPPRSPIRPDEKLLSASVSLALKTRFIHVDLKVIRKHLKTAFVEEWGTVQRVDSEEGDTMHASSMYKHGEDHCDPMFVRYQMLVDKFANQCWHAEELELATFYGLLQELHQLDIHFSSCEGKLDVIDITSVQCLIGRVFDGDHCTLIDCSSSLAHAIRVDDNDSTGDE